jgi:hypothetical protein
MKAAEAADTINEAAEEHDASRGREESFRKRVAVFVGVLAMMLAIVEVGGENAGKEMVFNNVQAANTWAFYQAKTIRRTSTQIAASDLEALMLAVPGMPDDAKAEIRKRADRYRSDAARYESEPETGEGRKELFKKARDFEAARDEALKRDPYFDLSKAFFQIAIVLASVSIVATSPPLAGFAVVLGGIATLLGANGFFMVVDLGLH